MTQELKRRGRPKPRDPSCIAPGEALRVNEASRKIALSEKVTKGRTPWAGERDSLTWVLRDEMEHVGEESERLEKPRNWPTRPNITLCFED